MSNEYPIDMQPGESLDQAILRLAASLKETNEEPETEKAPKKKAEPKVTVTDPSAGEPVDEAVHSAIHVYKRENESDGQVRVMGTRYREMNGPGTLVFVHQHKFGEQCIPACRERVIK